MAHKGFLLPTIIMGPADINRSLIELQSLEEYLLQARTVELDNLKLPKTSRTLDALADINQADLLQTADITHLKVFLKSVQQHAPVLHISFAAEPSVAFSARIVEWLRSNVSKYTLVQVGLQPSIAAGCVLRGTNKVFDMSLRRYLLEGKPKLVDIMRKLPDATAKGIAQ